MWMTTKWCGSPPSTSDHYWGWCEGEHFWWEMEEHWIWTARWCDRMWKRRNLTRQDTGRGGAQVVREGPTMLFGILAPKIRTCGWLWVPPKVGYTSSSTDSTASERLYCWWQKKYFIINTQNDGLSRNNAKCQIFTVFKLYSFTISIFVPVSIDVISNCPVKRGLVKRL